MGRRFASSSIHSSSPLLWPRRLLAGAIRVYQKAISPLFPRRCRFYPSCSEYTRQALLRYGLLKGGYMGVRRLLRCHPWHPGGYDPVR
ncbi:MAG: membrane protein insertion efficiency factor YidD [Clostridia bacterium]|nr:membrane protein insertion efficiency factor YidD [Bacillota bacterium]MBO2521176.1 membrane protein insertion efficiency factor YidD [Bacillota bacterium]